MPPNLDLGHAHNQVLQAALDLGIPGLVGFLALWLVAVMMIVRNLQRLIHMGAENHPYYVLTVGLAGSLLAGWLFGLFDAISLGARPGFLWWFLMAMAGGVHYLVMLKSGAVYGRRRKREAVDEQPTEVEVLTPVSATSGMDDYPDTRPTSRPRMRYRPPSET